jgi:transmembrane sensor
LSQERLLYLLEKYTSNQISEAEKEELFYCITHEDADAIIGKHFDSNINRDGDNDIRLSPNRAQEILSNILHSEKHTTRIIPLIFRRNKFARFAAAAVFSGILFLTVGLLFKEKFNPGKDESVLKTQLTGLLIEQINQSNAVQEVRLEDGSIVLLQPGSRISFPEHFEKGKREVYMQGQIFFDVMKNANRPFYVYNKDLVIHVLGTSFHVKNDEVNRQAEVDVVSGRVQVYEKNIDAPRNGSKKRSAVILMPNQKLIFNESNHQFTSTLVSNPLPVTKDSALLLDDSFVFSETKIEDVIAAVEKMYGVEILVQDEEVYQALFTGNVSRYGLYEKLDLICESINATYEINGTKILIQSRK